MKRLPELGAMAHPVAVAADRHDMAVVDEAVDESGGHDVVAEDLAPSPRSPVPCPRDARAGAEKSYRITEEAAKWRTTTR
jgi:hypothetical protein